MKCTTFFKTKQYAIDLLERTKEIKIMIFENVIINNGLLHYCYTCSSVGIYSEHLKLERNRQAHPIYRRLKHA